MCRMIPFSDPVHCPFLSAAAILPASREAIIAGLAGLFLLDMAGMTGVWIAGAVASMRLRRLLSKGDPAFFESLYTWDGVRLPRWGATPPMLKWMLHSSNRDTPEMLRLKKRLRRCFGLFASGWVFAMLLLFGMVHLSGGT